MAIEITKEEVFAFHDGGKVRVALSKPLKTQKDLCLAYTPGVAQAVKAIAAEPTRAFDLSAKRNLVAVRTDHLDVQAATLCSLHCYVDGVLRVGAIKIHCHGLLAEACHAPHIVHRDRQRRIRLPRNQEQ